MTTLFFAPPECFTGRQVVLPEDEARHAVRVLRHREGDEIQVVDGAGGRHVVRLTRADKHAAEGTIVSSERDVGEPPFSVTVGLGTLKQPTRFETFVEKAVELGVTEIVPLVTDRTERARMKAERAHNIIVAAIKQSGRSRLPKLLEPASLNEILEGARPGLRLLCHESARAEAAISRALEAADLSAGVTVLIGPEGGFSEAEVARAEAAGWRTVSLGPRRLRAETAAMVAATAILLRAMR